MLCWNPRGWVSTLLYIEYYSLRVSDTPENLHRRVMARKGFAPHEQGCGNQRILRLFLFFCGYTKKESRRVSFLNFFLFCNSSDEWCVASWKNNLNFFYFFFSSFILIVTVKKLTTHPPPRPTIFITVSYANLRDQFWQTSHGLLDLVFLDNRILDATMTKLVRFTNGNANKRADHEFLSQWIFQFHCRDQHEYVNIFFFFLISIEFS